MTQSFKKVSPGQPYHGFPADFYNALVDVVNAYRGGNLLNRTPRSSTFRSSGLIQIKNASGGDLDRLSVLGLSEPIFTPTDDLEEFRNRPRFDGISPTSDHEPNKFAILIQPLKTNEVGLACVAGVTPAKVYVTDSKHEFAAVEQSTTTYLKSTPDRGAKILWKDTGEDTTVDAIVRMPAPPQVAIVELISGSCTSPQLDSGECVWEAQIQEVDVTGANLCSPWQAINTPDCYVVATNECEDLTKMKLRGGERFIAIRVGQWGTAGSELPLYAIMAPHGKVRVNEDDELDYLEDQYEDHVSSSTYATGDILVKSQTDDVGGDKQIRRFVETDDYDSGYEQVLTHDSGSDTLVWKTPVSVTVMTDVRIYNNEIQKRTSTIKVIEATDDGWSTALPATEC